MEYKFQVKCKTSWHVFDTFLTYLKIGKPFDVLDNRERQVLASIYAKMDIDSAIGVIKISKGHYNVKLTSLRKKGLIDENDKPKYRLAEPTGVHFSLSGHSTDSVEVQ